MCTSNKSPEVDSIVYFVKNLQPKTTLEIGCNYGRELKFIEDYTKVYGIDKDSSKIFQAKDYVKGEFKVGDASNLPYKSNRFDLCYSSGVFVHNPPEKIVNYINEMIRVSKKYVLIVEYIGSKLSQNTVGNCKQNAWVHDYELLVSTINATVKYNRKQFFGSDCFHIILLEKNIPNKLVINKIAKESQFVIKIGKLKLEIL